MKRRDFLINSLLGLGGVPLAAPLASGFLPSGYPFTLGIASGDATEDSTVLWTRLAPEAHRADGGMPALRVPVQWQLARDAGLSDIVQAGEYLAGPELAHSVHINVEGLEANREYWYRFSIGAYSSSTGRTRTLPSKTGTASSIRFATCSCQNYSHGYFVAYKHMLADKPDFVIHLGDYIYDTSFGDNFRPHETEKAPLTLNDFRRRHATYKSDKHLQAAHAQLPFFTTIDNHDAIEDNDPGKYTQRAAAYQAWYEHMPVRGFAGIGSNHFDLQRKLVLGDLMQISLLDSRQFRDRKDLCRESMDPNYGFGNYRERCAEVMASDRSMLGERQEKWLINNLLANSAAWNVIASPGPFLPFQYRVNEKDLRYIGAWDAYPANRARIAAAIEQAATGHPLVLSGDVHSFWALDGYLTEAVKERTDVVEFICSSISANWPEQLAKPVTDNLAHNPQVKFYEPARRGYLLHEVNRDEWRTTMRAMEDVRKQNSSAFDLAAFRVLHGQGSLEKIR